MTNPVSVADRLAALTADQRAAATAPPGPTLCIAPAGSGKTTTLVARIAWLVAEGADPTTIAAITFNARAADELSIRLSEALGSGAGVRVRTFHALGREILAAAGESVDPLVERTAILRRIAPDVGPDGWRRLDDAFSRLKLDLQVTADDIRADPEPGAVGRAFVTYEEAVAATGGLDFDDLVARALRLLRRDPAVRDRWRASCADLLVDEVQDVDRSQLELALLLAAPDQRIFLVGDDDQSIYGWRLADVRRVIGLADTLPGLRRFDLTTNFRCPAAVVERAVRLVAHNRERFPKEVRARTGATGRLILAPDGSDDAVRIAGIVDSWPDDDSSRAILSRTNRELLPALAVALDRKIPFRAPALRTALDEPELDAILDGLLETDERIPLLIRLETRRRAAAEAADPSVLEAPIVRDLLAAAAPYRDARTFVVAVRERRSLLLALRRDDARLTLATAHGTKGLEFDHVAVVGMERGRFPSARAIAAAAEPERALEEERRLAYVAWTRARRSLTISYDPAAPSPFLDEAFDELPSGLPISSPELPRSRPHPTRAARGA
ncbi:MAG: ATP-dependent helicase [Candidatus Limnocylindrales bacterium]